MEQFAKFMGAIGSNITHKCNPFECLPVELTQMIFRTVDPHSLLNIARVSKQWHFVCRGDSRLKSTARRHLKTEKRRAYDLLSSCNSHFSKASSKKMHTAMKTSLKANTTMITKARFAVGAVEMLSGLSTNNKMNKIVGSSRSYNPSRLMTRFR